MYLPVILMSATNLPNSSEIPLSFSLIFAWNRPLIWGKYLLIPFSFPHIRFLCFESDDTRRCLLNFVVLFTSSSLMVSVWSPLALNKLSLLLPIPMPLDKRPLEIAVVIPAPEPALGV